jgi:hypothetical protein
MKALLELVPFLNGYPIWVRGAVVGLPPIYALGVALLYVLAPAPTLRIDIVRPVKTNNADTLSLEVIVRNATAAVVNITTARLELYGGEKPEGGLSGALTVSAVYTVEKANDGSQVVSDQDKLPHDVAVTRPYAGNSYTRVDLPLAQEVDAGKSDRFIIVLHGPKIREPQHNKVELELTYNGDQRSNAYVLDLN